MKQKIFNVFVSLSNIIVFSLIFFYRIIVIGLEPSVVSFTIWPVHDINELISHLIIVLPCVAGFLNLVCIIQNIKNKKLLSWYIIFFVYWLITSIVFITKESKILNESLKYIIYIIYFILGIVNFLVDIKNKIKIWKIILYAVFVIIGVVASLYGSLYLIFIMLFIMQLINNKSVKKDKIINKIINIILFLVVTIIIVYTCVNLIILRIEWKKINDETIEWAEKIENVILDEEIDEDDALIPVKKNGKFGYINKKR